jgi:segregation and condensation protein A
LESSLTNACQIRIENFEGPFDLLFHLIEKNQMNIYDIPINDITDQYMEYLYAAKQLDLEVASEFLLMAATLLHIKSKLLLPSKKEKEEDTEVDPREELVLKLVEYRKYKEFSGGLKIREAKWEGAVYKLPEVIDIPRVNETFSLSPDALKSFYLGIIERNKKKRTNAATNMKTIMHVEKVSLKSKIRQVLRKLMEKATFRFSEIFSPKTASKLEVVTGFLAVLELTKLKKVSLNQEKQFGEITIERLDQDIKISLEHIED